MHATGTRYLRRRGRRGDATGRSRLALAERALTALVADAESAGEDRGPSPPPRLVRPRDAGRSCATRAATTSADLLGMKWVTGSSAATRRRACPNQRRRHPERPHDRRPEAILDGGPSPPSGPRRSRASAPALRPAHGVRPRHLVAAIIGAGVQGHSHATRCSGTPCRASAGRPRLAPGTGRDARRDGPHGRDRRRPTRPRPPGGDARADVVVTAASFADRSIASR